jgi:hypothetical protein
LALEKLPDARYLLEEAGALIFEGPLTIRVQATDPLARRPRAQHHQTSLRKLCTPALDHLYCDFLYCDIV